MPVQHISYPMDFKQLEYFTRVAELGSFTRASHVLRVAQPALSRQVRLLEQELQQPLLSRNGHGVTPNEAGLRLLEHARGILHQFERAREDMGRVQGTLAARVMVGMSPSMARVLSLPLTREMRVHLPHANLSINEGLSVSLREWLLAGRLDMALLYDAPAASGLDVQPLHDEPLFLVSPRGRSEPAGGEVNLRTLAQWPLVLPGRPNALRMLLEAQLSLLGLKPMVGFEIDGYASMLDLVADGAGHSVVPRHAIESVGGTERFRVRAIVRPRLKRQLSLASASGRVTTLTQQAVRELIVELTGKLLPSR